MNQNLLSPSAQRELLRQLRLPANVIPPPRLRTKQQNQLNKSLRRQRTGKPSYRQRQASARAAKAQRRSTVLTG